MAFSHCYLYTHWLTNWTSMISLFWSALGSLVGLHRHLCCAFLGSLIQQWDRYWYVMSIGSFAKKDTQETIVIFNSGQWHRECGQWEGQCISLWTFCTVSVFVWKYYFAKGKKRKNSRNRHAVNKHIHKEKRIHRYADFKAWHWGLPSRKRENKYSSHAESEFPCRQMSNIHK